ncbi:hypothetical protein EDD36DRAFT_480844 [Exophiala viscosa]|uniref:Uncharacterized protein n=1 Tax=Exophiala viscosa TaxID=2486360 RepID=A0AAN6E663_9EURO|nr:hypothetical protein EDD36DRAFT_480844 [Exophiala viscosa]
MAFKLDTTETKVTVTSVVDSAPNSPSLENGIQRPEQRPWQANLAILAGVLIPTIPILVASGPLLGLLFHHRIDLNPGHPELRVTAANVDKNITDWISLIRKEGGEWAYYVEYNPSTLTTIASWTSRILPWCASTIMALVAFYAARNIILKSHRGDGSDLPNPKQLTILIDVLKGSGWGPVKDTVLHRYRTREPLVAPLPASTMVLFAITLLGIIIPILDSWFGVATTAPVVTQLYPRSSEHSFGRALSSAYCPSGPNAGNSCLRSPYNETFWPCSVLNYWCYPVATLYGLAEASKTAQGVSTLNKVWNYTDSSGTTYYYLGSPSQSAVIDYKAHTIATRTHSILQDTSMDVFPNVGIAFSQNPQLSVAGDLVNGPNADLQAERSNYSFPEIYSTNPLYFGAWAAGYPVADPSTVQNNPFGSDDTGVYWVETIGDPGGAIWQLNCSTAVYEVSYTWIDGAVHTFNVSQATADMAALLGAPFGYAANLSSVGFALASAAEIASTVNTSVGLAAAFAHQMDKNLLAYSVGVLDPALNLLEQGRNSTLRVARVPIVPLYLLLATKAIFVIVVLVLAIGVYCFSHPSETEAVRAALSAKGLAEAHFQSPGVMQANVVKEVQSRLAPDDGPAPHDSVVKESDDLTSQPRLRHAATAPVQGTAPVQEAKVGLLPTLDGKWQSVMVANGVWNSIKPIVQNIVVSDASAGGLGDVGQVINAWK